MTWLDDLSDVIGGDLAQSLGALFGGATASGPGGTYAAVEGRLQALEDAVDSAISKDIVDDWATRVQRGAADPIYFALHIAAFEAKRDALKKRVRGLVASLKTEIATEFGSQRDAPTKLKDAARTGLGQAAAAQNIIEDLVKVRGAAGWIAGSRDLYVQACDVQIAAATELKGVIESAAKACTVGAGLNSAVFLVLSAAIDDTVKGISVNRHSSASCYYVRTTYAEAYLQRLEGFLPSLVDSVTGAAVSELNSQLRGTLEIPVVLSGIAWPSGLEAAGQEPADTGSGVQLDTQADLSVEVDGLAACYAGVWW